MTVKEIRAITGLSQRKFAQKYGIPRTTLENWESNKDKANHRKCPDYVLTLLERAVREDFRYRITDDNTNR